MSTGYLTAKRRRRALEALSRDRLVDGFELEVQDRRRVDLLVDALHRARTVPFEEILEQLKRKELKDICRALDLDDSGKRLDEISERILTGGTGAPDTAEDEDTMDDTDAGFRLEPPEPEKPKAKKPATGKAPRTRRRSKDVKASILSYRHQDKRKNNPQVGLVKPENDADDGTTRWEYDPHIDPALQFDMGRDELEKLIDHALESGDPETMRDSLEELRRLTEPYLNWAGKAERTSFDVDSVSLHVHERIDPLSIISSARKRAKDGKDKPAFHQPGLFDAPFENLPLRDAVDFYKHERGWANRLVLGDSLLVMNSLLEKESMAGQVQMIYIDPPYGIKYGSNFQPFVNKRDVKDRKDEDLTQEPEMIKAFRDTWEQGVHSYLTYLRDRLLLSHELLRDSGSVFVQIGDENIHHVRELVDEVFGGDNFVSLVSVKKTGGQSSLTLANICDYAFGMPRTGGASSTASSSWKRSLVRKARSSTHGERR